MKNRKTLFKVLTVFFTLTIIITIFGTTKAFCVGEDNFDGNKYIGPTLNLGTSGNVFYDQGYKRDPSFSFQIGGSYLSFYSNWFALQYTLSYKKFYMKYNNDFETYDYLSFNFGTILNIKKFLLFIDLIGVYSFHPDENKNGFRGGLGGGLGYILYSSKKMMIPIRGGFEIYAHSDENEVGGMYGVYIKLDILFRVN